MANKKIITIAGIVVAMFILAYLFVTLTFASSTANSKKEEKEKHLYKMPSQIVNLSGTNAKRYLKIELLLEYESDKAEETVKLFEKKKVYLTDTLIMLLSNKTIRTIDGYANKETLKEEIKQKFQQVLFTKNKLGKITAVYYNTFLIQ